MAPAQAELWQRLQAFEIDDPDSVLTFSRRLARENGWSLDYALRVIDEYKKFCFLAVSLPHSASPSEQIDQAWHLHLTYTRNYWGPFCRNVLRTKLHHHPTRGGQAENDKHVGMYEQTLRDYQQHFSELPPADIWPDAGIRFGDDLHARRINRHDFWMVPKPRVLKQLGRYAVIPAFIALGSGLLGAIVSPLDLPGPQFAVLYLVLFLVAAVFSICWRLYLRRPAALDVVREPSSYELACLNGGPRAVMSAAIVELTANGAIKADKATGKLVKRSFKSVEGSKTADQVEGVRDPVRRAILHSIVRNGEAYADQIWRDAAPEIESIVQGLRNDRLLVPAESMWAIRWVPIIVFASLLCFGVAKLVIGLQRERPVGFLIGFLILTAFAAIICFPIQRRTRAGSRLLETSRKFRENLRHISGVDVTTHSPNDLALAVALFGFAALPADIFAETHKALGMGKLTSANGAGTGCGGTTFGCGGAGCGGGCGGGGCGGCS